MSTLIPEMARQPFAGRQAKKLEIRTIEVIEGPNIWCRFPVCVATVRLSMLRETGSALRKAAETRLVAAIPDWARDRSSGEELNVPSVFTFTQRESCVSDDIWVAQMLLGTVQTLHALSFSSLRFGCVEQSGEKDVVRIAVECEETALSRACIECAVELCEAAINGELVDLASRLQQLRTLADDVCLGATTSLIVAAARQKGIPVQRLGSESLVQLGHGSRQRRIQAAQSDQTGTLAEAASTDKHLTKSLLRQVGVPVPEGRPVHDRDDAWNAACEIGLPVVVKPRDGDYGVGVTLNLNSRQSIRDAYDEARQHRDQVMVERFAIGEQYRVTVVGQKVAAAVRRVSPVVLGDGVRSVNELIDKANEDSNRGPEEHKTLKHIRLDVDTLRLLAEQSLSLEDVPAKGKVVKLSRLAHLWSGGTVEDVTDCVHPDVAETCARAARVIGLDIAGIDVIAQDIGRPLACQGGMILEVNAAPAIFLHLAPFNKRPRPVCEAILEHLFPQGTGRIPTVLICDSQPEPNTGQLIEDLLFDSGLRIGRSSSDGIYVQGKCLRKGSLANRAGARAVLLCPDVDLAILQQSWDSIRREGLAVDRCDIAILQQSPLMQDGDYEFVESLLSDALVQDGYLLSDLGDITRQKLADALVADLRTNSSK